MLLLTMYAGKYTQTHTLVEGDEDVVCEGGWVSQGSSLFYKNLKCSSLLIMSSYRC